MRYNLQIAQNRRFVMNSLYPGGGTIAAKILDSRIYESLEYALFPNIVFAKTILKYLQHLSLV